MAIRYSGDVEARVRWTGTRFDIHVSWPKGGMASGSCLRGDLRKTKRRPPNSSEAYDEVAEMAFGFADRVFGPLPLSKEGRNIIVKRVFQAPCPYEE
jgi:hypothetical protein